MTPTLRRRRNQSTESALPALGSPSRRICAATVDEKGKTREKVYDDVWSGDRERGPDGKLPPVKNTVDLATATYLDVEGAPSLYGFWSDPEFNAEQPAFYYLRLLPPNLPLSRGHHGTPRDGTQRHGTRCG